jgi:chromate reductase, NAD(P)H dehydrogenase (quinone)
MTKILAFAGSISDASVNLKLVNYAVKELREKGQEVTIVDLKDYPLPIYSEAAEFPKEALELFKLMNEHSAWIIASPEHNSSITVCLKNLIDWTSRAPKNQTNLESFVSRVIGLISASPSNLGGVRGLRHLREILVSMGAIVIPSQATIGNSYAAFDDQGNLINERDKKSLSAALQQLTKIAQKFSS